MHHRRVSARILALTLTAVLIVPLLPTGAAGGSEQVRPRAVAAGSQFGPTPKRVYGRGTYGTAIAISRKGWRRSSYVVLAGTGSSTEQLLAAPLAGAYGAPLLLTGPRALPTAVAREIKRLRTKYVFVVGGSRSVSANVVRGLRRAGIRSSRIKRFAGKSVYATSRIVAGRIKAQKRGLDSVVVINRSYPQWALGALPMASRFGMPILLTTRTSVPADTAKVLTSYRPKQALLIGSTSKLSSGVASRVQSLARIHEARMVRISAGNADDAAKRCAELSFAQGFDYATVVLANSGLLRDAAAAGPWAGKLGGMVVLTRGWDLPETTEDFIFEHCSSIKRIWVLGGSATVASRVLTEMRAAAKTEIKQDVKVMPAALNSQLVSISPDGARFYFSAGADLASILASDVIVSGPTALAPSGYLRRVLNINRSAASVLGASTVAVDTTGAGLADVLKKGSIDVRLGDEPDAARHDGPFGLQQARAVDETHVDVAFGGASSDSFDPTETVSAASALGAAAPIRPSYYSASLGSLRLPLDKTLYEGRGMKVWTQGSFNAALRCTYNASFGVTSWRWVQFRVWAFGWRTIKERIPTGWGLQSASFITYFDESLDLRLFWKGDWSFNREWPLGRFRVATIAFAVGPVPVWIDVDLVPSLGLRAELHAEASTGISQAYSAALGFRYDCESGTTGVRDSSSSFVFHRPTATMTAYAKAWAGLRAEVMFYSTVGPWAEPRAYLEVLADSNASPWLRAYAGVEAAWGGRVNFLGYEKRWEWGLQDIYRRPLWPPSLARWSRSVQSGGALVSQASSIRSAGTESDAVPVALDPATIQSDDFSIEGLTITGAALQPDGGTVRLTTSPQARGQAYTVSAEEGSVATTSGATALGSCAGFSGYWPVRTASASAVDSRTVDVAFDSQHLLDSASVEPSDFSMPGLTVSAASVRDDGQTVRLTTSPQAKGTTYTVSTAAGSLTAGTQPCEASGQSFVGHWPITLVSAAQNVEFGYGVELEFDSYAPIHPASVEASDFEVPGLTVLEATRTADRMILLTTSQQIQGSTYDVTVRAGGLTDGLFVNPTTTQSFYAESD